MRLLILAQALALAFPSLAAAATLTATPANVDAVLARAKGGDIVQLKGAFGGYRLQNRTFSPQLVIDASGATIGANWYWKVISGITFRGGTWAGLRIDDADHIRVEDARFVGPEVPAGIGVLINGGKDIVVTRVGLSKFEFGVVAGGVDGLEVLSSTFTGMGSDGIQIAAVHHGRIADNEMSGTVPLPGAHPDCVQVRSTPDGLTSDLTIEHNTCTGDTQGISFFNGPYKDVIIRDNQIAISFPQGIGAYDVDGLTLQNNRVRTMAGSKWAATINTPNATRVVRTGNRIEAYGRSSAVVDPK